MRRIFKETTFLFALILMSCRTDDGQLLGPPQYNFTNIEGTISGTLTLIKSPYWVNKNLLIDSTSVLRIEPGVEIYFNDSVNLTVQGKLVCVGSSLKKILFSSKQNSWRGIIFSNSDQQSVLRFVIVENIDLTTSYDTIRTGSIEIINTDVVITNSIFRNNRSNNGGAISIAGSTSIITNNIFLNNYAIVFGGAIISSESSNEIVNNTFYKNESSNYGGGVVIRKPIFDNIQNNIFYKNICRSGDPRIAFMLADTNHYKAQYNFLETGTSNPFFRSETDFRLNSSSPCINAGNPDSIFTDADGTRNDQGAYGGALSNW